MTLDAHVEQEEAAGLASLPEGDAARDAAFAHATQCPACARALAEGAQLVALLGAMPAPPAPSSEALARAMAPVLADLDAPKASWPWFVPAGVTGAMWAVMLAREGHRNDTPAVWAQSLAQVLLAVALAAMVRSLGRMVLVVAALSAAAASLLALDRDEVFTGAGLGCAGVELVCAALPLGATALLAANKKIAASGASYAGVAAAGALAGHAALHVACPAHSLGHLSIFHVGAVMVAGMIGAAVGQLPGLRAAR